MIAECAVEPEVMAEWKHFHSLHGDFGVGQGRLLCQFPSKWRKQVLQAVTRFEQEGRNSARQAARILAQVQQDLFEKNDPQPSAFRRSLVSSLRDFPAASCWVDAARVVAEPFDLIIHSGAPSSDRELQAGEFLRSEEPFHRPQQIEVRRLASDLIAIGWACFRRAKEIYVVDPFFRPCDSKYHKVLGHLLSRLEREASRPARLEVHTSIARTTYNSELQKRHWDRWARDHLPSDWTLKVVHWKELETGGRLHARYILTDFGGIDYNWGTDEDPGEETQVGLLCDDFWLRLYNRFAWQDGNLPEPFQKETDRILTIKR
ncbi:hypothetical protein [Haloferula sp. A504]|uniref:hypothetical protein n=1 Tax=Haloferula sp. A504 TaxID=3373601 RepID=UPI0031C26EF9|nr:hypothetical protein [Verrucomicrobiaceae bacterium E54]